MITQEHINTVLGAALYNLGYPVGNAALWKEELGAKVSELSEEVIVKECERLIKEQRGISTTWDSVRTKRDAFLKDSDWSAFPDANPKPSKEAWLAYRQTLRDLPSTFKTPEEVVWPEAPNK